jgi:hypothetical protein
MRRAFLPVSALLLTFGPFSLGGPVDGTTYFRDRVPKRDGAAPGVLPVSREFVAGQRACIIVIGDHNPVVDLEVKVYDLQGQLVAEDRGTESAPDFVAAMWYPPRQQTYRIEVRNYGAEYNEVSISIK